MPLPTAPGLQIRSLQSPQVGYLAAILLQVLAGLCVLWLARASPPFEPGEGLMLLTVALVALIWGVGPGLLALVSGIILATTSILNPYFFQTTIQPEDVLTLFFDLVIGLAICLFAYRMQQMRMRAELDMHKARKRNEELTAQLQAEREARREGERELQMHERQLEAILGVTTDALFLLNMHGASPQMNRVARALLDLSPDAGIDRASGPPFELLDEHGDPLVFEEWPEMRLRRGERISEEDAVDVLLRTHSGKLRHIRITGMPIRDADGAISGAVMACRDVTEHHSLESHLLETQRKATAQAAQLEALFDAMTDGVFVYDAQGELERMNQAARSLLARYVLPDDFSLPAHERARRYSLRRPDGGRMALDEVPSLRILRGEVLTSANAADVVVRQFNGADIWINMTGTPLYDASGASGQISGAIIIARDVTERRALEQRTRKALAALLEMAQVMVQGSVSDVPASAKPAESSDNDDATSMEIYSKLRSRRIMQRMAELTREVLGCSRLGLTGIEPETERMYPLAVVGLPPEQERQWWREQEEQEVYLNDGSDPAMLERLRAHETLTIDFTRPPFDAAPNPYAIRQMLVAPMAVGTRLLGLLTLDYGSVDHVYTPEEIALTSAVTELATLVMERDRLQAEADLARANELAARSANQLKDEFISIASHELRTPMTSMKANIQLALRLLRRAKPGEIADPLSGQLTHFLERAEQQLERQNRLVRDLLDVSRIETGRLELSMDSVDLAQVARETVEDQLQVTPTRSIQLELPPHSIAVMADRDRLSQVMSNYLSNALKYSELDCPVVVRLELRGSQAVFSVQDQGPGLSATDIKHIWERFYRAPGVEVRSGSGVGLGLGLYISRLLIERQGGTVGVESIPGQGSTFWFTLDESFRNVSEQDE